MRFLLNDVPKEDKCKTAVDLRWPTRFYAGRRQGSTDVTVRILRWYRSTIELVWERSEWESRSDDKCIIVEAEMNDRLRFLTTEIRLSSSNGGRCPTYTPVSAVVEDRSTFYVWINVGSTSSRITAPARHDSTRHEGAVVHSKPVYSEESIDPKWQSIREHGVGHRTGARVTAVEDRIDDDWDETDRRSVEDADIFLPNEIDRFHQCMSSVAILPLLV